MEDIYLEYLIKRKKDGKQMVLIALIIIAAVIVSFALFAGMMAAAAATFNPETGSPYGSFIFGIGLVLIAMVWYGSYLLINMQNIEFEYILTNSELDIDKVLSKKGRKGFVSFDFKNVTVCAGIDDAEHKHEYNRHVDKTYNAVGDYARGGVYFADYQDGSEYVRVLFQPTSKMIEAAWKYNPRNIFVTE